MFFTRVLRTVSLCVVLTLPAGAMAAADQPAPLLSIAATDVQEVDPALRTFMERVWQESPAMQGAEASLEAARARAEGASQPLYNPDLAIDAERSDITTATIGLSQTLDWSDKLDAQSRVARREIEAAQAEWLQTRRQIAAETLAALARYHTARQMVALAQRRSELMKGFVDTVRQRQAAGDMGAIEGTLAQVAYSEALMQQAADESELAEAEAALRAVTGMQVAQWPSLPSELAHPPAQMDTQLIESLPQLALLRSRIAAAKARVELAQREGRADPTIGFRAGKEDSETLLGLSLEIPLFVRNNYKAQARAASHEAVVEELAYRELRRRIQAELQSSLGRFQNTARAWQAWLGAGQAALVEQQALLEQMWSTGELTATDFLIQAKQNIDTQATATTLAGEVWQAAIVWLATSGQIEAWLGLPRQAMDSSGR